VRRWIVVGVILLPIALLVVLWPALFPHSIERHGY